MAYTVYMHTFPNGKTYIGITRQDVRRRWRKGDGYIGQPVHEAIKKYGWGNITHTILAEGLNKEDAENAEIYYIAKYKSLSHENGYNIEKGGNSTGRISEETKKKMSMAHKGKKVGKNHWNYGQHWSDDVKRKISEAHKGMKYGAETIEKKRKRFSGANNPMYGVKMTPEHKEKLQAACVKATSRAVICVETGIIYPSMAEAQRRTGICSGLIMNVCKHKPRYKTAGGYHWEYKEVG